MTDIETLLANNRTWAESVRAQDPEFFARLARQQRPAFLWIGCADSRVPANQITGLMPGEVFVHRNVANVFVHSDLNALSVLQFAVEVLEVKHIIVCGHYGCGGVRAALDEDTPHGLIDNWLEHIRDVRRLHAEELAGLSGAALEDRLCELNVVEQVRNVRNSTVLRAARAAGREPSVHGWIYRLDDGLLKDLRVDAARP